MTLVESIDRIVAWLKRDVCSEITLKVTDDYRNDSAYDYQTVNPAAFPLYVPGKERLPPSIAAPIPSICAQLMEGNDDLTTHKRELQFRLCLACWNPGEHGAERLIPTADPAATGGVRYFHPTGEEAKAYVRNSDGWRDVFNMLDMTLRSLEGTEFIEGHRLMKERGIKYGVFTEDGNVVDYYPYWLNWITFTLEAGVVAPIPAAYQDLL